MKRIDLLPIIVMLSIGLCICCYVNHELRQQVKYYENKNPTIGGSCHIQQTDHRPEMYTRLGNDQETCAVMKGEWIPGNFGFTVTIYSTGVQAKFERWYDAEVWLLNQPYKESK